jgi:hypothetical protein
LPFNLLSDPSIQLCAEAESAIGHRLLDLPYQLTNLGSFLFVAHLQRNSLPPLMVGIAFQISTISTA